MTQYTDARGSTLTGFMKQPKRIVSLVPSQTELLHDLNLEKEVTGITKFCIHPQQWYRSKARVGGTKNVNLDAIKSLQPDLILANKEENVKEQIEALAAEFPVWVTDVNSLADALEMIAMVGILTGKREAALALEFEIAHAFKQLSQQQNRKPLRVCYLIWQEPYLTVGADTFIHDMLEHAGFENIFATEKRYPVIPIEEIQIRQCELLLLSSEPYPFTEKHRKLLKPLLPNTKIMLVDGELFSWYGSRLLQAPAYFQNLRNQLHTR